jgi:hypothetical protein
MSFVDLMDDLIHDRCQSTKCYKYQRDGYRKHIVVEHLRKRAESVRSTKWTIKDEQLNSRTAAVNSYRAIAMV